MDNLKKGIKNADLNSYITYTSDGFSLGNTTYTAPTWNTCWQGWDWRYPSYHYHYDTKPNSFELSFKIVSKLLEKKIIQKMTLKQFIETIGEVAKLI